MKQLLSAAATPLLLVYLSACVGQAGALEEERQLTGGDPEQIDGSRQISYHFAPGTQVEVCNVRNGLNNRSGPSTGYMVLRVLPPGASAVVRKQSGSWFYIELGGARFGWSYGHYLCSAGPQPHPPVPAPPTPSNPTPSNPGNSGGFGLSRDGIINTAKAYVGFSYWWGGARFPAPWDNPGAKDKGKCYSSSYSGHSGSYGADCSGFASKVWQLPNALPFDQKKHPYSTYHFYNQSNYWNHIDRGQAKRADAMVYRSGSSGHILIYESGSPWGQAWTYEARGCSYGVVHNLRSISSSYRARRRHGV
jgi:Bacterial SH3 domain